MLSNSLATSLFRHPTSGKAIHPFFIMRLITLISTVLIASRYASATPQDNTLQDNTPDSKPQEDDNNDEAITTTEKPSASITRSATLICASGDASSYVHRPAKS